jgi:hypothetical protein
MARNHCFHRAAAPFSVERSAAPKQSLPLAYSKASDSSSICGFSAATFTFSSFASVSRMRSRR